MRDNDLEYLETLNMMFRDVYFYQERNCFMFKSPKITIIIIQTFLSKKTNNIIWLRFRHFRHRFRFRCVNQIHNLLINKQHLSEMSPNSIKTFINKVDEAKKKAALVVVPIAKKNCSLKTLLTSKFKLYNHLWKSNVSAKSVIGLSLMRAALGG